MNDITDLLSHVTGRVRQEDVDGTIFTPFYRVPTMTWGLQNRNSFCFYPIGRGYKRKIKLSNFFRFDIKSLNLKLTLYKEARCWSRWQFYAHMLARTQHLKFRGWTSGCGFGKVRNDLVQWFDYNRRNCRLCVYISNVVTLKL